MKLGGLLPLLAAAGLVGCGSLSPLPALPSAGDLLSAPTALNLAGRTIQADSSAALSGQTLNVTVTLASSRLPIPALKVTGVYLVTAGGVWAAAPAARQASVSCHQWSDSQSAQRDRCVQVTASGPAQNLSASRAMQVVVQLNDGQGHTYWLRDGQGSVVRRS